MRDDRNPQALSVIDHDRAAAGLTYVYPVVSRRARGVSIGINLNTNNACNWRCIYCQVPNLVRGTAPVVNLPLLKKELLGFLSDVLHGDFLTRRVPADSRRINDIALSGNGEPTSAREFEQVIDLIAGVRREIALPSDIKLVLITNGSLMHRINVRAGVEKMRALNGEVWFKLDSATEAGMRRINNTRIGMQRVQANLAITARSCPTWIQTCVFAFDGAPPSADEQAAYLSFLRAQRAAGVPVQGVLLYGLARHSFQPEASRLSRLPALWLEDYAARIRALGFPVKPAE